MAAVMPRARPRGRGPGGPRRAACIADCHGLVDVRCGGVVVDGCGGRAPLFVAVGGPIAVGIPTGVWRNAWSGSASSRFGSRAVSNAVSSADDRRTIRAARAHREAKQAAPSHRRTHGRVAADVRPADARG